MRLMLFAAMTAILTFPAFADTPTEAQANLIDNFARTVFFSEACPGLEPNYRAFDIAFIVAGVDKSDFDEGGRFYTAATVKMIQIVMEMDGREPGEVCAIARASYGEKGIVAKDLMIEN